MTLKVGQMVIRQTEGATAWQKQVWEEAAQRRKMNPYSPVEIQQIDDFQDSVQIKEMGTSTYWKIHLFKPVLIDKKLEDYM